MVMMRGKGHYLILRVQPNVVAVWSGALLAHCNLKIESDLPDKKVCGLKSVVHDFAVILKTHYEDIDIFLYR